MKPTPNTTLYLLKNVDLDPEHNYTIDFDDIDKQVEYFIDKKAQVLEYESDYSYIRDNETLKVQVAVEDLLGVNYLMYKNSDKWFFAFITRKDYVNSNTTRISFKLDVYQSFMFDYELQESFIDREHQDRFTADGTPIYNNQPENLEIGDEYKTNHYEKCEDNNILNDIYWVEVVSTQHITGGKSFDSTKPETFKNVDNTLKNYNVNTGLYVYLLPIKRIDITQQASPVFYSPDATGTPRRLYEFLYNASFASTAVISVRVLPYSPVKYALSSYSDGYLITFEGGYKQGQVATNYTKSSVHLVSPSNDNWGGVNASNWGGYYLNLMNIDSNVVNDTLTPSLEKFKISISELSVNNLVNDKFEIKLKAYPYRYIDITNYTLQPLKLKEQYVRDYNIKFVQSLGAQSKIKLYNDEYLNDNGKQNNIVSSSISELPLRTNAYISYLASSKASATTGVALNIAQSVATLGIGVATGGVGLALAGTSGLGVAGNIANTLLKRQDLKNTPDSIRQMGNNAEFDIIDNNIKIELREMVITDEFKKLVFSYFMHYGYKANIFKIPNIRSRYYYNYIKVIGVNINTNIDAEYKNELATIFNNGVTIWHYRNKDTFKGVNNYAYENVEMSLI